MLRLLKNGSWINIDGNYASQVVEAVRASFPPTGNTKTIYVATDENKVYRWDTGTSSYVAVGGVTETPVIEIEAEQYVTAGLVSVSKYMTFEMTAEQKEILENENVETIKIDIDSTIVAQLQLPTGEIYIKRNVNRTESNLDLIQFTFGGEQYNYGHGVEATPYVYISQSGNGGCVYNKTAISSKNYLFVSFNNFSPNDIFNRLGALETGIATKENTSNKVTSVSSSSTDAQYPSAKCVYKIKELAEGKIKGTTIDTTLTSLTSDDFPTDITPDNYYYKDFAGTQRITTWEDFQEWTGSQNPVCCNSGFDSTAQDILSSLMVVGNYILVRIQVNEYVVVKNYLAETFSTSDYTFKDGDVFWVIKKEVPDRWIHIAPFSAVWQNIFAFDGDKPDLSAYASLSGNNTFTGTNTFSVSPLNLAENKSIKSKTSGIEFYNGSNLLLGISNDGGVWHKGILYPQVTNSVNIGASSYKWKDLYLSGSIKDGTNSVSVAEIANGTFNVINASEIINNTLTQAQYDLMLNGKPTYISGTLLGGQNRFVLPGVIDGNYYRTICSYHTLNYTFNCGGLYIYIPTRELINPNQCNLYTPSATIPTYLNIKGKVFPDYPSNSDYKTLDCNAGSLVWSEKDRIVTSSATTYNNTLLSKQHLVFSNPVTSLTITGLEVTDYDYDPEWHVSFKAGASCTVTLPTGTSWVGGTAPTWTENEEFHIEIVKGVTTDTYIAKNWTTAVPEANYELIETITLTEAVTTIERNKTPLNVDYNYKKMYITIYNYVVNKLFTVFTTNHFGMYEIESPSYSLYNNQIWINYVNGFIEIDARVGTENNYGKNFPLHRTFFPDNANRTIAGTTYTGPQGAIKALKIDSIDGFQVGTVIKIYGAK